MKSLTTLLFLICLQNTARLQTHPIDPERNVVISTTGMNLREFPNRGAAVLVMVPFGETVHILEDHNFGVESIGYYQSFNNSPSSARSEKTNIPIKGDWIKAEYQGKTGYVFGAYLGYTVETKQKMTGDINTNYVLLYHNANCFINIYDPGKYNWYGLFKRKNGFELKPVKISYFYVDFTETGWTPFVTTISESIKPIFILGSKNKMEEGKISGKEFLTKAWFETPDRLPNDKLLNDLSMELIKPENKDEGLILQLILKHGYKRQLLNNKVLKFPNSIEWKGDLDNDGKEDYLISYGEVESFEVLYLSSAAGPDQIVRAVAVYYSGYCC